jgi:capsular polysaccharide biosynthesis protein
MNEAAVEMLFEGFGFRIVRPEGLSLDQQIALIANARLVAGPGGSAMFNLAFQRRLKSVLLIVPEFFMQITEWLLLAGVNCSVNYHVGTRDPAATGPVNFRDAWRVDLAQLGADVARWLATEG